ncbi:Mobile element protein [Fimbriiglobus ruber]|uniref:Mobile element protein n=2 Tax=Fimbriiglobus ruber TaxID=1908690 RepID=A0A225DB33_9BACT|nr:Mobile element protein [Fimbriiglobus ruber]
MGCQKEIATTIRAEGGDYLLAVKDNQPHLRADLEALFDHALEQEFASGTWDGFAKEETNRGRAEMRQCWVLTNVEDLEGIRDRALWTDLKSVIVVVSERGVGGRVRPRPAFTSVAGWPRPGNSPDGRGIIGALRTPSQTTGEATTCARSGGPVTIALEALLALAAWCDQRPGHGGTPCPTTTPSSVPPSLAPPAAIWAQLPPERRRQLQRLLADLLARPILTDVPPLREARHDRHPA